ncbi:MAG: polysaccharide pyruvyl transferase family protein [Mucilaginibacter sp.]|nr:polysaccharide pyruvyl transferase family protein [Mucilaginibacter sp.]
MIIELRGVDFINKGAELMLRAILEKTRERYPKAVITMQKGANSNKEKLAQNGIKFKLSTQRSNRIGQLIPSFLRHFAGYYLDKEIDVVLDGSGFAFGDQWGAPYAERRMGAHIEKWHTQGKKIILLAQAFGPFESPDIKNVMEKIINNADLIFTREEESDKYLKGVKDRDTIVQSPDFTNLITGILPSGFDPLTHQVAIVPNYKMVASKTSDENSYVSFLKHCIAQTIKLGLKPYFLIHEGVKDLDFALLVNKELESPIPVLQNDCPLQIKGIIGSTKFIICSRFHGVVSALSQGIPCVVTGWSHKYAMLLKDYGFEEGLIANLSDFSSVDTLLAKLKDPDYRLNISSNLKKRAIYKNSGR